MPFLALHGNAGMVTLLVPGARTSLGTCLIVPSSSPPYWEMVTLYWSRGRRRERRDLAITVGQEQKGHSYLGLGWRAVP